MSDKESLLYLVELDNLQVSRFHLTTRTKEEMTKRLFDSDTDMLVSFCLKVHLKLTICSLFGEIS